MASLNTCHTAQHAYQDCRGCLSNCHTPNRRRNTFPMASRTISVGGCSCGPSCRCTSTDTPTAFPVSSTLIEAYPVNTSTDVALSTPTPDSTYDDVPASTMMPTLRGHDLGHDVLTELFNLTSIFITNCIHTENDWDLWGKPFLMFMYVSFFSIMIVPCLVLML